MPLVVSKKTHEGKSKYLKDLFAKTYISDVIEHNKILNEKTVLEDLLNIVASSLGSLTNPTKPSNTFKSVKKEAVSSATIGKYLDYFIDAFMMYKAFRYDVDVGVVEYNHKDEEGKKKRTQLEIDFVANKGSKRYYIQSALSVSDEDKRKQEINSLTRVGDSFKKIVVVKDDILPWHDDQGILHIGIEQFLLEENAIDI